jgi:hypothetical protein
MSNRSRHGGLSNKKLKKYSTMSDYLEAHHPKVYELFSYLGMQGALTPRRGGGLTLLVPDSKTVDDLHKVVESEDAEKASDILSGLVIQDNLGSEKDWAEKQDDIPTLLGKRVPVKSVSAGKVVLEGGAELTLEKNAKFLTRVGRKKRDPMSVWILKGSFDPTSAPDATYKYVNQGGKKKGKGERVRGGLALPDNIWKDAENRQYVEGVLNQVGIWLFSGGKNSGKPNPAAVEMTKLINALESPSAPAEASVLDPEKRRVGQLIQSFCRGCPVSDFLSVWKNPLATKDFGLAETLGWLKRNAFEGGNMRDVYVGFLSKDFAGASAKVSTTAGRAELDAAVVRYLEVGMNRANINFASKVKNACEEVEQSNMIGGVGPIFPEDVHNNLKNNSGLFLLMEEHYYYICPRWNSLRNAAEGGRDKNEVLSGWKELLQDIQMRFDRYSEPHKMTRMDKKEYYSQAGLTDQGQLANCVKFWSSAFMRWKPVNTINGGFDDDEFANPYSRELTNLRYLGADELEDLPNEDAQLSERALTELMAYKEKHGALPNL